MANPPQIAAMVQLFEEERFDDALARVDELLVTQPELSMAWRFKGECLTKLLRYEEAIPCLAKADTLGGRGGADAIILKATAEWNAGKRAEARATLDAVVENAGGRYTDDVVATATKLRVIMETKAPDEA